MKYWKSCIQLLLIFNTPLSALAADYYVSPQGSNTNPGTLAAPWDLQTALCGGPKSNWCPGGNVKPIVAAGDQIWIREGTYNGPTNKGWDSYLNGDVGNPIIVRNYNSERAILNDSSGVASDPLQVYGSNTWVWGLEFQSSASSTLSWDDGVSLIGNNHKLINNFVHDTMGVGIVGMDAAVDAEIYGNLVYYNGRQTATQNGGYCMYLQNRAPSVRTITDNLCLNQWGNWGMHIYGQDGHLDNFSLEGNVQVHNAFSIEGFSGMNNISLARNYFYSAPTSGSSRHALGLLGYCYSGAASWGNVTLQDNRIVDTTSGIFIQISKPRSNLQMINNLVHADYIFECNNSAAGAITNFDTSAYPNNQWILGARPTTSESFVIPNRYEAGRANIVVYNWDNRDSVTVSIDSVSTYNLGVKSGTGALLASGTSYVIKDAQNFFGPSIAQGIYTGGTITIPMTSSSVAVPINHSAPQHTNKEFGVFVLLPSDSQVAKPGAPTSLRFIGK